MKNKKLQFFTILVGIAIVIAAGLGIWKINKDVEPTETPTSDWQTYKNEEFGFELQYPKSYENDDTYRIWETTPEKKDIYGNYMYRIATVRNVHTETIFSVEVFPKNKKEEIVKERDYKLTGKKVLLANNIEAEKVDGYETQLFIERDNFIYFISSFVTPEMKEIEPIYKLQYDEYQSILQTLKIY